MKCSKCGQECKENQRICVKCGTPLPVIPEMKEFEQRLADEIEGLMEEPSGKSSDDRKKSRTGNGRQKEPVRVISLDEEEDRPEKVHDDEEDADDFRVLHDMVIIEDEDEDEDEFGDDGDYPDHDEEDDADFFIGNEFSLDDVEMALRAKEHKKKQSEEERETLLERRRQERIEKNNRKKKRTRIAVIAGISAVVLAVVILLVYVGVRSSRYSDNYNQGVAFVKAGNYGRAAESLKKALTYTGNEKKIEAARYQLYLAYMGQELYDEAENELKDLIEIDGDNVDYYKNLIDLYRKTKDTDAISALLDSVSGKSFYAELVDYNVDTPKLSVESGEYGTYVRVDISLVSGKKLYYSLAKGKEADSPISGGKEYTGQILIQEEGTWSLKAVAVSANGAYSEIASAEYVIEFTEPEEPEITPENGKYTDFTQISVTYPEHDKLYYTIDEELDIYDLEESATLYTEPFDMERGNHIYRFVVEGENGLYSNIVTRFYNFAMERTYDYDEAVNILKQKLYGQGILKNASGSYDDNTYLEFSYVETPLIDKKEYFVISFSMRTNSGKTVADDVLYGINAADGHVVNVSPQGDGTYKITEDVKLELPVEEPTTKEPETEQESESGAENNSGN